MSELSHRTVASGHELVTFWMRSNERRYDKEKAEWVDGKHFSVKVTCWRKLAAAVHASLSKGDPVIVSGRLQTTEYEAADGQSRSTPELDALAVGPNLNWCTATVQRNRRGAVPDRAAAEQWLDRPLNEEVGSESAMAGRDEPAPVG